MKLTIALAGLIGLGISGCGTLPKAGPTTGEVIDQSVVDGQTHFAIIDIDDRVIDALQARPAEGFRSRFSDNGIPPEPMVRVGDAVAVSIWEAGGGGLFGQSASNAASASSTTFPLASIPPQIVSRDGAISVPFAGRIPVIGRTVFQVQQDIEQRLKGKAADPQVIVSIPKSAFNSVTVSGEVVAGAQVPLSPKGDRILDAIAAAGGARASVYNIFVRLTRGGVTASIPLETLVANPAENIYLWPGDTLTLVNTPQYFDAFGAVGRNSEIPFDAEKVTLSQALAKVSGLLDERADPAGVFLLRDEPAPFVAQLKPDAPLPPESAGKLVPVVYHLDMSNTDSFFLARRFLIADKDVLYVANAKLDQVQKFFNLIGTLTSPLLSGLIAAPTIQSATK